MPVPGFLTDPEATPDQGLILAGEPSSKKLSRDVLMTGGSVGSLTDLVAREAHRELQDAGEQTGLLDAPRMIDPEEANGRYGVPGRLAFDKPVTESEAAWRHDAARDEAWRTDILQRSGRGPLSSIGLSLTGGAVDPGSLALNFLPMGWLGRLGLAGEFSTRSAAIVGGALRGAAENAPAAAVSAGATYGLAHGREGRDYSLGDAGTEVLGGLLFGSTVGGLTHGAGFKAPARPSDFAERLRGLGEHSRQDQTSNKGAVGVSQMLPATAEAAAKRLGIPFDLERLHSDKAYNIQLGNEEARHLLERFHGDEVLAAAAYNAGPGRVDEWLARFGDPRTGAISHEDFAKAIPFKETRDYVARVTAGRPGSSVAGAALQPPDIFHDGLDMGSLQRETVELEQPAREGAMAAAIDDLAQDRPVDVAPLLSRELELGSGPRPELDDAAATRALEGRFGDADMATTPRGQQFPVRYAVVELEHLLTSHDDDLVRDPAYPEAMQPRDRTRAGYAAQLLRLQNEFVPGRLMGSSDAESGAPIAGPDGVIESGNGRTIALRRMARAGSAQYEAYKAALTAAGHDISGFDKPALVRVRANQLDGQSRVRLAREMNAAAVQGYSVTEQAVEDARALTDDAMGLHGGGEITLAANRRFVQHFVDQMGAGSENELIDGATKGLTRQGAQRIEAAILMKAYGDRDLVYALYETTEPNMLTIGKGLAAAAPEWARMRAAAGRGETAAWADVTGNLTAAAALVRHARDQGLELRALVEGRMGQTEMFGGETMSPMTEAFLRLFFRDEAFKRPTGAAKIGEALDSYARKAQETTPGPGLFGDSHDVSAQDILDHLGQKLRAEGVPDLEDAIADLGPRAADAAVAHEGGVQEPGHGPAVGPQPGLRPEGGQGAGEGGAPAAVADPTGGDPELKALLRDSAALEAELHGYAERGLLDAADVQAAIAEAAKSPDIIAAALKAAGECLLRGGE